MIVINLPFTCKQCWLTFWALTFIPLILWTITWSDTQSLYILPVMIISIDILFGLFMCYEAEYIGIRCKCSN